ncbi:MAG: insulinase family protein [Acholeplasmatales bacterium]|nr:insulinase family protein [Acholeplasmatales bacterium]
MTKSITLSNGSKLILSNNKSQIVYCSVLIKYGSLNDSIIGTSHFIEHLVFSRLYKNNNIINSGCVVNAYTSREYTLYSLIVSKEKFNVLSEIFVNEIFNCEFDVETYNNEKKIIEKEILYEENSSKILEEGLCRLYNNPNIYLPICGTNESINNISLDYLIDNYNRNYMVNNSVTSIVGNIDYDEIIEILLKQKEKEFISEKFKFDLKIRKDKEIICNKNECYCCRMWGLKKTSKKEEICIEIIINLLGGGMTSDLYKLMRGSGLSYIVGANRVSYSNYGCLLFYANIDSNKINDVTSIYDLVIANRLKNGINNDELDKHKNLLKIKITQQFESSFNVMEGNAISFMFNNNKSSLNSMIRSIDKINCNDVNLTLRKIISVDKIDYCV